MLAWAAWQLLFSPTARELSENSLQNLQNKWPPHPVDRKFLLHQHLSVNEKAKPGAIYIFTYSQNVTIYEAQISLSNVSNYEEEDILPYMDAMESAASPTEVGCYENLNPDHEESFIKESEMTLAFFICGFEKEIKLQDDPSGQRLYFVDFYL